MFTARKFFDPGKGIPLADPPRFLVEARSSTGRRRTLSAVRNSADEPYRYDLRGIPYEDGCTGKKKRTLSPCEDGKRGWWKIYMLLSEALERLWRKSLAKYVAWREPKKRKGGDPIHALIGWGVALCLRNPR